MNKMKKFKLTLLVLIILAGLFYYVPYIINNNYIFLYISPDTNTKSYPYIAGVSKKLNDILFKAVDALNIYAPNSKVLYTNGYGTGFVKDNVTATDFDYNAGIYIGNYEYNGQNSIQIAGKLLENITRFQTYIISITKNTNQNFYIPNTNYLIKNTINSDKNKISESIRTALEGNPYSINVGSGRFELSPHEVLLPNYMPVTFYNSDISYFENYREILREITLSISYYFDLTNPATGEKYSLHFVAATPEGKRIYQPEFKYFVPNIYTSINSFNYVRKITGKLNDNEYVQTRLTNYFNNFYLSAYGNSKNNNNPLKIINNLIQCVEVLSPILPKNAEKQIRDEVSKALSNSTVALLNDYYRANDLLFYIIHDTEFYNELQKNNSVSKHISDMEKILNDMINDPTMTYNNLKPLFEYQKKLSDAKNNMTGLQNAVDLQYKAINDYLKDLMTTKISGNFDGYMNYLNKVIETAGIYNIKFYNDRPDHIYVFRDKFTYKLRAEDIAKLNIQNGDNTKIFNENTAFEFKSPEDFYEDTGKISYGWVMYKPTKLQKAVYEDVKKYLLKDKQNYHIRIRAGLER